MIPKYGSNLPNNDCPKFSIFRSVTRDLKYKSKIFAVYFAENIVTRNQCSK